MSETLIVGLGNPILSDDGVGWRVVARVRQEIGGRSDVRCITCALGGLALAELLVDASRVILVDALLGPDDDPPGTVYTLGLADLPRTLHTRSAHDADLPTALAALRRFGAALPPDDQLVLIGITVADVLTFGETMTPGVAAAVEHAAQAVLDQL